MNMLQLCRYIIKGLIKFLFSLTNMDPQNPQSTICIDPKAYRFFPSGSLDIDLEQEQKTSFTKDGTRFFFYGHIEHDDYEKEKLSQFDKYLEKNNIEINRQFWHDQKRLQILGGNGFKMKQTYEAIKLHQKFREEYIGPTNDIIVYENIQDLINQGVFYPCGRDKLFRPIIVFNIKKVDLQDVQKTLKSIIYVQEKVIKNMFLPGQVENWVIIYDLAQLGITEIPVSVGKEMIQMMSRNYGGRLYRLWVVNAPFTVALSWKVVSTFLDKVTQQKVRISKKHTDKDIFKLCDPSQVEKKYGGSQPNREVYWPFHIPEGVYDEARLVDDQKYQKMVKSGKLHRNIIDPQYQQVEK